MNAYCPHCQAEHPLPSANAHPPCGVCGAPLVLAERFVLVEKAPVEQGADVADGAAPMWKGQDTESGRPVIVRLSPTAEAARLRREATILRGLSHPRVPRVLALDDVPGVGLALVLTRPSGACLETALEKGLRTDARGGRRFLEEALSLLSYLHALSPPVFHRHIQPRALFWDAEFGLSLVDFARATDVIGDAAADGIVPRAGFVPPVTTSPTGADLYAVGATLVHVLTRTPPAELPQREERPAFRAASHVDEQLASVIERLLFPERRDAFTSADEALAALAARAPAGSARRPLLAAAAVTLLVMVAGLGGFLALSSAPSPPPPEAILAQMPTPTPQKPEPQKPEPQPKPEAPAAPVRHSLKLSSSPSGAEVRLGEELLGTTPLELQRAPGRAQLTFSLAEHQDEQRAIVVSRDVELHVQLAPQPKATPAPAPPPPFVSEHDAFLKKLRAAILARRSSLSACGPASDRLRFQVVVGVSGEVAKTTLRGQPTQASSCVERVLRGIEAPRPRTKDVTADVLLWLEPTFKVAVH